MRRVGVEFFFGWGCDDAPGRAVRIVGALDGRTRTVPVGRARMVLALVWLLALLSTRSGYLQSVRAPVRWMNIA